MSYGFAKPNAGAAPDQPPASSGTYGFAKQGASQTPQAAQPSVSVKTLPDFLGGGAYNSVPGQPQKLVNTGHGNYGGVSPIPGNERADTVPVSLGGSNTSKQNISPQILLPESQRKPGKLTEADKYLEENVLPDYKSGKISLSQARENILTYQQQHYDTKGGFHSNPGTDVNGTWQSQDILENIGSSIKDIGKGALDKAKSAWSWITGVDNKPLQGNELDAFNKSLQQKSDKGGYLGNTTIKQGSQTFKPEDTDSQGNIIPAKLNITSKSQNPGIKSALAVVNALYNVPSEALANFKSKALNLVGTEPVAPDSVIRKPINDTVLKRISSGVQTATSALNLIPEWLAFSTGLEAAKNVPGIPGLASRGVSYGFSKISEAGSAIGNKVTDILPISEQAKATLRQPLQDLSALATQLITAHYGAKVTGKYAPEISTKIQDAANKTSELIKDKVKNYQNANLVITPKVAEHIINDVRSQILSAPKNKTALDPNEMVHQKLNEGIDISKDGKGVNRTDPKIKYNLVDDLGVDANGKKVITRTETNPYSKESTINIDKGVSMSNPNHIIDALNHEHDKIIQGRIETPALKQLEAPEAPKLLEAPKPKENVQGEGFTMSNYTNPENVKLTKAQIDYNKSLETYNQKPTPETLAKVRTSKEVLETAKSNIGNKTVIQQKVDDFVSRSGRSLEDVRNAVTKEIKTAGDYSKAVEMIKNSPDIASKKLPTLSKMMSDKSNTIVSNTTHDSLIKDGVENMISKQVVPRGTEEIPAKPEFKTEPVKYERIKDEPGKGTSKIAKSIEAKAIEDKMTSGFGNLAGYDKINIKEQSELAADLVNNHLEDAIDIIRGDKPLPENLRGTALVTALEEHIRNTKDSSIAYDLANSELISQTSKAAQEMRLAAERIPDAAAVKLQEIKKTLEDKAMRTTKTNDIKQAKNKITKELKESTEKIKLSKEEKSWDRFLEAIKC